MRDALVGINILSPPAVLARLMAIVVEFRSCLVAIQITRIEVEHGSPPLRLFLLHGSAVLSALNARRRRRRPQPFVWPICGNRARCRVVSSCRPPLKTPIKLGSGVVELPWAGSSGVAHNPKVAGSNPAPANLFNKSSIDTTG
jgi:hypothetical protein